MTKLELPPFLVHRAVAAALEEDLGQAGDITTDPIISADATAEAEIVARKPGVVFRVQAMRALVPSTAAT